MANEINKTLVCFHIYKSTHEMLKKINNETGILMTRVVHNAIEKLKKEMEEK